VAGNIATSNPDYSGKVSSSDHNLIGNADGSSGFSAANGDLLAVISHHPACPVATLPPWTPDGGLVMATTRLRPAVPPPWPPIPRFHLPLPLPSRAISSFFSLFPR